MSIENGIEEVRKGFFAFFIELSAGYRRILQTFHEDEKCNLQEIPFLTYSIPHFSIPQKSPYLEIFRVM